jgi:hypothetical protein
LAVGQLDSWQLAVGQLDSWQLAVGIGTLEPWNLGTKNLKPETRNLKPET